jgi:hypothetical protein
MGTREIAEHCLADIPVSDNPNRVIRRDRPGIFGWRNRIFITWFQKLHLMGQYRMEVELSTNDILHLFKARFGTELRPWLLDEGFTLSPEMAKHALKSVKLTDLTLGDLVAMNSSEEPATAEKLVQSDSNVTPLRRRI